MELNSDFIAVQGLMRGMEKTTGEFTKIKYRGGNESKIQIVVEELRKFMCNKGYINEKMGVNKTHQKELLGIVTLLVLNSEFKDNQALNIKEFSHLINIMPIFSKCLMVNVVIELELTEFYAQVLHTLPLCLSSEMLGELVPCLKRKHPGVALDHIYLIVREIIKKLSGVDLSTFKVREAVIEIGDITSELLLQLSRFDPEAVQGWKKKQNMYEHMGHLLLKLFKLMQYCQIDNEALTTIIDQLIMTTSRIVMAVTINVFCAWAEVEYNSQPLQLLVSTEAYNILEKYSKHKRAHDLIEMLGTMARKPKSLQESILEATPEVVVNKINENNADQRQWFNALLNTQVFNRDDTIACLDRWSHLCTINDVNRILKLSIDYKGPRVKQLVIKCASNLTLEDLTLTLSRYFRQFGIGDRLTVQDVHGEVLKCTNKVEIEGVIDIGTIKVLELLFLQAPTEFLEVIYCECSKNGLYSEWLRPAFSTLKDILVIEGLSPKTLKTLLCKRGFHEDNYKNYAILMNVLIETGCCDLNSMYFLVRDHLGLGTQDGCELQLKYGLLTLDELNMADSSTAVKTDYVQFLMKLLEKYRCSFTKFSTLDMEITIHALNTLKNLKYISEVSKEEYNQLNRFYILKGDRGFLDTIFSNFSIDDYGDAVSKLIKILSRCVPDEWAMITNDLHVKFNTEKSMEVLTDTMILICQVANTQNESNNSMAFVALRFYLECYGISMKHLQNKENNLETEVMLIKNVVRVLKAYPPQHALVEGVNLLPLFSERALKQLKNDKTVLCSLFELGPDLSSIIAKMIMA